MSDFPDPDEEFELMYGDDLDLLREQDFEDQDINVLPAPKVRKSLDFTTPSKNASKSQNNDTRPNKTTNLDNSFESGFQEFQTIENTAENNATSNFLQDALQVPYSNAKKRTVDDLFGNINDIEEEDNLEYVTAAKKCKKDDQLKQDLELIDLIIQKRKDYKKRNNIASMSIGYNEPIKNTERDKHNLSFSVPRYPFIRLKSFNGQSVYIRCHSENYEKEETERVVKENTFHGVMGDHFKKVWEEAQELLLKGSTNEEELTIQDIEIIDANCQEKQLWVDLYKPRKYLELLSDESTNRTILRWMKLWDKIVFNRNPKIKAPSVLHADKKRFFKFNELNTNLDEYGRPEHKVALLCGPPGLGKTTLAHMVAKHSGYNVVEINASDDRSTDAFRTALENATQMRSVVDQEKRPNCIVFDEIDGAPAASIDFLIKFIIGTAPVKGKKYKTKEKGHNILKRPIICICNDVYVPALRPLRQIAFVINFPQTSSPRLAERLMEIARRQQIKTDMGAMMALAEKSNNDIRSCLSVLHFYKAQNKSIGLIDIYKTNVGQKDMQKGLFTVWYEIFENKRTKKATGGSSVASMKERMQNILSTISSFGDHERIAQGVYENFPRLHIKDGNLEGTSCALDWFCFNDIVTRQIYSGQNYSLTSYLNYAFVVWHFVFASFQKQKLTYPSASYENRVKEVRQKAIVAEVLRGMAPSVRCYNAALPLVLDVLPLILRVISPPFRPVSFHLYTEEERKSLLRVAGIMADYNLNYIQERKADGVYEFKLEPNIEELAIFDKEENDRKQISYSNKQLLAREIEIEKMRRFEAHATKKVGETKGSATEKNIGDAKTGQRNGKAESAGKSSQKMTAPGKATSGPSKETALPNHLQTLQFKALKSVPKPKAALKKDFFGRIIQTVESSSGKAIDDPLKNDIWFQYKEGFSNAVKKKIKVKDLK